MEQGLFEKKNDIDSGQIIVLKPDTGKILALANFPNFDPNQYSKETDLGAIYNTINDIISGELQGEFDTVSYFNEKRNVVINKNNLDDKNIIYLVSSPQEKEYVMFAIKR